jgi:hypothetical protein
LLIPENLIQKCRNNSKKGGLFPDDKWKNMFFTDIWAWYNEKSSSLLSSISKENHNFNKIFIEKRLPIMIAFFILPT